MHQRHKLGKQLLGLLLFLPQEMLEAIPLILLSQSLVIHQFYFDQLHLKFLIFFRATHASHLEVQLFQLLSDIQVRCSPPLMPLALVLVLHRPEFLSKDRRFHLGVR